VSKAEWLALSGADGVGGATLRALLNEFGSIEGVHAADDTALQAVLKQVSRNAVRASGVLTHLRRSCLAALQADIAALSLRGIELLTPDDAGYPVRLRDPGIDPCVLYLRGSLLPEDALAVAIVGTRRPTPDALDSAAQIARELAGRGVTVVSGLATGIDTGAHRGALEAGGRTIAVLPSGFDAIHPTQNVDLADTITQSGALVSEYAPDVRLRPRNLMIRNGIVVALSLAVIIVQADARQEDGQQTGSMDAAARAVRLGRALYAIPESSGADELIDVGCKVPGADRRAPARFVRAMPLDPSATDWAMWVSELEAPTTSDNSASSPGVPTQPALF
jgi:DNA processing protein